MLFILVVLYLSNSFLLVLVFCKEDKKFFDKKEENLYLYQDIRTQRSGGSEYIYYIYKYPYL